MINHEFDKLENTESDSLLVRFNKKSWLEAHAPITFKYLSNGNKFTITIYQDAPYRSLEIRSQTLTKAKELWELMLRVTRLCMLFDGEFMQLTSAEFQLKNIKTYWSDDLTHEYRESKLLYYSSANFTKDHNFACPLSHLTPTLLEKWREIEEKLDLVHPMALYAMSSMGLPADIKVAILIETFEPLHKLIQDYNPNFKRKLDELRKKYQINKDGEPAENKLWLKIILAASILVHGTDIFDKENIANDDYMSFCQILANSRNRVFHINGDKRNFLSGDESVLYLAKLTMLYRKVLLDMLGIDYNFYKENLKKFVGKWNAKKRIIAPFLQKIIKPHQSILQRSDRAMPHKYSIIEEEPHMSLNEQLLAAAALAQAEEVVALIEKGANVNAADENGETALMKAAKSIRKGRVETVKLLIEAGADINSKDNCRETALMRAASRGRLDTSIEVVKFLISAGANIHTKSKGWSALTHAASANRTGIVQILVEAGAKIKTQTDAKETLDALRGAAFAERNGDFSETFKWLCQAGLLQTGFTDEKMLLELFPDCGYREGLVQMVAFLIRNGVSINFLIGDDVVRVADKATERGITSAIELLIESGALTKTNNEHIALFYAVFNNHAEAIKLLIEFGADIDKAKKHTVEILEYARHPWYRAELERCEHQLEGLAAKRKSSSQKNRRKQDNLSILHAAAINDTAAVSRLIKEGANLNQTDTRGRSALSYAVLSDYNMAAMLINAGADINLADIEGYTPLMLAASVPFHNSKIINLLVSAGADVNTKRNDGKTALMDAVRISCKDTINALLEAGAKQMSSMMKVGAHS